MSTAKAFPCPECRAPVGGDSGTDPYKHAVNCLNLTPGLPAQMVENAGKQSKERGRRAAILLGVKEV